MSKNIHKFKHFSTLRGMNFACVEECIPVNPVNNEVLSSQSVT